MNTQTSRWGPSLISAIIVGLGSVAVAALTTLMSSRQSPVTPESTVAQINRALSDRDTQTGLLAVRLGEVERQMKGLRMPGSRVPAPAQLAATERSVTALQGQMRALQEAVGATPEKAIAVPLLRRDLEGLRINSTAAVTAIERDLDRQYDLMKWILGTFVVGMLSVIVSIVLVVRKT